MKGCGVFITKIFYTANSIKVDICVPLRNLFVYLLGHIFRVRCWLSDNRVDSSSQVIRCSFNCHFISRWNLQPLTSLWPYWPCIGSVKLFQWFIGPTVYYLSFSCYRLSRCRLVLIKPSHMQWLETLNNSFFTPSYYMSPSSTKIIIKCILPVILQDPINLTTFSK